MILVHRSILCSSFQDDISLRSRFSSILKIKPYFRVQALAFAQAEELCFVWYFWKLFQNMKQSAVKDEYSSKQQACYMVHQCSQAPQLESASEGRLCVSVFAGLFADVRSLSFCCRCEIYLFHMFSRKSMDRMKPNLLIFCRLYQAFCEAQALCWAFWLKCICLSV